MRVNTLRSRILSISCTLSKYGYDIVIYKGRSIDSVDCKLWSGRGYDIPIEFINKEVVDWAINWSSNTPETEAILTIVVL